MCPQLPLVGIQAHACALGRRRFDKSDKNLEKNSDPPIISPIISKESYSRVNGSKQQLNSFIIYDLDSIARVNEICKNCKKKKKMCAAEAQFRAAPFERPICNLNPEL